jgi:hypothetical protein
MILKGLHKQSLINVLLKFENILLKIKYMLPFLLLSMLNSNNELSNSENKTFDIINKQESVGFIKLEKLINNNTTTYNINSQVEARILFRFRANSIEKAVYRNDTLIFSSIYRKLNNKVKVNQRITLVDNNYYLKTKQNREQLNIDVVKYSLVMLYFEEPKDINKVYCEKLKVYLQVVPMKSGTYKVNFPNGNYNIFHYVNGNCTMIEAVGSFYNVSLVLRNKEIN